MSKIGLCIRKFTRGWFTSPFIPSALRNYRRGTDLLVKQQIIIVSLKSIIILLSENVGPRSGKITRRNPPPPPTIPIPKALYRRGLATWLIKELTLFLKNGHNLSVIKGVRTSMLTSGFPSSYLQHYIVKE